MSDVPISPQEAIENNDQGGLALLITTSVELAKWRALNFQIQEVFETLFPHNELPYVDECRNELLYLSNHTYAMLSIIEKDYPDEAQARCMAARDHDIELGEGLVLTKREHLSVIEGGKVTQMPEDPFGPAPG